MRIICIFIIFCELVLWHLYIFSSFHHLSFHQLLSRTSTTFIYPYNIKERQARAYRDNGINLATNTMANWVIKSADNYFSLVYNRLHPLIYDNHDIHARQPFAEFIKFLKSSADGTIAQEAHSMITEIMHIDNRFDDLPSCDRLKQRQLVSTEKVDAYFAWKRQKYTQVAHNSTIGRKNFVSIESSNGARASAMLYSLVETAKANQLNVYEYFELLLTEIPKHMDDTSLDFINNLLPWTPSVQETCPSRFKKS